MPWPVPRDVVTGFCYIGNVLNNINIYRICILPCTLMTLRTTPYALHFENGLIAPAVAPWVRLTVWIGNPTSSFESLLKCLTRSLASLLDWNWKCISLFDLISYGISRYNKGMNLKWSKLVVIILTLKNEEEFFTPGEGCLNSWMTKPLITTVGIQAQMKIIPCFTNSSFSQLNLNQWETHSLGL